ncbi:hypothetical protein [Hymenobacter fodinae]|uniref:Uncharacterized protein n=1 Tax=Hymenobacter fodinae TaxID=2510796 RepID=A0A4Z0P9R8_9BACT|nr:hypothetical protein [Hymenobacter fodinae]TGE08156.1 hypothetical protein EU556_10525 [Hymenobacter fodinae]
MNSQLQAAIENLYSVFTRYPLNPHMEGSPLHSDLLTWNRTLTTQPLRELSVDHLGIFYFKVMTTWGSVDDFRHFLPRIFDLLATLDTGWEEWVALDKLKYGCWQTWPTSEQNAVQDYLLALWNELLTSESEIADVAFIDYFPAIMNVYPNVKSLLSIWSKFNSPKSIKRLIDFVLRRSEMILGSKQVSVFDNSAEPGVLFFCWLTSKRTIGTLTTIFFQNPEAEYSAQLSDLIQLLEATNQA